ncbi:MAG: 50S ribosomal protein L24 [Candidatus Omnitrophica bacterium CG11_big_fil_rev_8_21_14_0_20_64_10]|nr:MAG: 50S ribosomal protein L24 [Candidatus Omnitrophica bacterium CG11_big_fil_rev_8_21_14_0_20_64_10]
MARVKKDDLVAVIRGKDKGKRGKILHVDPKRGRVIVEGVNLVKKGVRRSQEAPQGALIDREAPLPMDRVMPVDPKTGKPTRVSAKFLEDGTKVRVGRASKETF